MLSVHCQTQECQQLSAHYPPPVPQNSCTVSQTSLYSWYPCRLEGSYTLLLLIPRCPPYEPDFARSDTETSSSSHLKNLFSAYVFILHHYRRVAPPCSVRLRNCGADIYKRFVSAILSVAFKDQDAGDMMRIRMSRCECHCRPPCQDLVVEVKADHVFQGSAPPPLIASRISAVFVERPCCFREVKAAVRV